VTTPIRVLALDVDGTLLDPAHRIAPAGRARVSAVHAAGILVLLASARHPAGLREVQRELGVLGDPLVACQGVVIARFRGRRLEVQAEAGRATRARASRSSARSAPPGR
jgi:hydroxymethylpyrimidine pyrophosphatase-like HAD family hydrolase